MAKRRSRKRANGEGSIVPTKDRRWRAVVTVGRTAKGGLRRRSKICKSHADAVEALRELKDEGQASVLRDPTQTVKDFLTCWREDASADKAANTSESYRRSIETHIAPRIGAVRLASLSAAHVQAMLTDMRKAGVGDRTRQYAYVVLHAAMERAVRWNLIRTNPCRLVERPRAERKGIRPLTAKESRKLIEKTAGTRSHALFVLALATGMRQGELFGLRFDDIDLKDGKLRIERQAVDISGTVTIGPVKTDNSRRTLDLTPKAIEALESHRALLLKEGNAGSEFVFCAPRGGVQRRGTFRTRVWQPLLEHLKIDYRGFHHTRHTYATLALGAGVPVHVVSKILGHSKPSVTLNIYAHFVQEQQSAATAAIAELLA